MNRVQKILLSIGGILVLVLVANLLTRDESESIIAFTKYSVPFEFQEEENYPYFETVNLTETVPNFPLSLQIVVIDKNEEGVLDLELVDAPEWLSLEECIRGFTNLGQEMECLLKGETDTVGEYMFSMKVTDSEGDSTTNEFTLKVVDE